VQDHFLHAFFWIFSGATVIASLVLYTRQPLLVAYILLGVLLGPSGMNVFKSTEIISSLAHVGIVFLLFLIGLDLRPRNILQSFKTAFMVVPFASLGIILISTPLVYAFDYSWTTALLISMSFIYSSTIIGVKLLPTTVLHHKHTGELLVALLLVQDLFAIIALVVLNTMGGTAVETEEASSMMTWLVPLVGLPGLMAFAYFGVKFVIIPLIRQFERFQEFIFLCALGWCLGVAHLAHSIGLSYEIGAFLAGLSLTQSAICHYVVNALKPIRDFFLILFFFSLGAGFNLDMLTVVLIPAAIMAAVLTFLKPFMYQVLLRKAGEEAGTSKEIGYRLGQVSEFSLLIAFLAFQSQLISNEASHFIQLTTIFTFIISSYLVILKYPTPIAISDHLRRD
tara:strand:- start:292 stop:1476 length:1185 start_codon:yes stop_codon:yes gene_type:complete